MVVVVEVAGAVGAIDEVGSCSGEHRNRWHVCGFILASCTKDDAGTYSSRLCCLLENSG